MILLLDVGNTHTHLGLADSRTVVRHRDVPTPSWLTGRGAELVARFVGAQELRGAILCSVVPRLTPRIQRVLRSLWGRDALVLTHRTLRGVGVNYPKPASIGPDRLANAAAARQLLGAPVVVVDFGTAVTFDVVDRNGDYVGGIIAPGLAAMTDYLHEKTALLPRIRVTETRRVIGKSTTEAMLIGAVRGYRGLVKELLLALRTELGGDKLPVVGTGGYARLISAGVSEIDCVEPLLTLDGLRLVWHQHSGLAA